MSRNWAVSPQPVHLGAIVSAQLLCEQANVIFRLDFNDPTQEGRKILRKCGVLSIGRVVQ